MFFKSKWNDKKEAEYKALKEETRNNVMPHIKDAVFELVAHQFIAIKTDLWNVEEFESMVNDMLAEAEAHFKDMEPEEILEDRINDKSNKLGAKVIKVTI